MFRLKGDFQNSGVTERKILSVFLRVRLKKNSNCYLQSIDLRRFRLIHTCVIFMFVKMLVCPYRGRKFGMLWEEKKQDEYAIASMKETFIRIVTKYLSRLVFNFLQLPNSKFWCREEVKHRNKVWAGNTSQITRILVN